MNNRNIQELKEDGLCVFGEDYDEICCYKSRNDDSMNLNSKFKSILLSFGARNSIDDEPNFDVFHYNSCSTPDTISSEISNDLVSLDSIIIDQMDNDCIYYENILNHNHHNSNSCETNNDYNNYELFTSPSPSPSSSSSSSTNDNFNDFNVKFNLSSIDTDDIYDDFCEIDNFVFDLNTNNVHVQIPNSNVGEEVVVSDESENKNENNDSITINLNNNTINNDSNNNNNTLIDDDQNLLITNQQDKIEITNELTTTLVEAAVKSDKEQSTSVVKPVRREINDRLKMFLQKNSKPYQINKPIKPNDDCEDATTTTKTTKIRKTTLKLNNNKLLDTKKDWLKEILKGNNRIKDK